MVKNKQAFTLIELLVVVLIIGILAAVAVPQYQKAVIKSRFAEAKANLQTLSQATQACRLADPTAACNVVDRALDVEVPASDNFWYTTTIDRPNYRFIAAQYRKEAVCLCLFNSGKFVVYHDEEACPSSKPVSYDYAKLLNVLDADDFEEEEEEWACTCC